MPLYKTFCTHPLSGQELVFKSRCQNTIDRQLSNVDPNSSLGINLRLRIHVPVYRTNKIREVKILKSIIYEKQWLRYGQIKTNN